MREWIAERDRTLKFSKEKDCFLQRKYSSILQREKESLIAESKRFLVSVLRLVAKAIG